MRMSLHMRIVPSFTQSSACCVLALTCCVLPVACSHESTLSNTESTSTSRASAPVSPALPTLEKIIGANDLIPVQSDGANLPEELRPLIPAIGQLNIGCTATHIGQGLVLTAGHCISVSPRSSSASCRSLGVVWGNVGEKKNLTVSKCISVVKRVLSASLDFAVLKVENPPAAFVEVERTHAAPEHPITFLSYPRMRPLEWSQECQVSAHPDAARSPHKFLHNCDSEGGSSGGPLISRETFKIIGIHGGSSDALNYATFSSAVETFVP